MMEKSSKSPIPDSCEKTEGDISSNVADDRIIVGEVLSAHGLDGAVRVRVISDIAGRFDEGSVVIVNDSPLMIEEVAGTLSDPIIYFEDLMSRDEIMPILGSMIYVPLDFTPEPEEGEYFHYELPGMQVVLKDNEEILGTVVKVERYPTCDAVVLKSGEEIPLIKDFVSGIDRHSRIISVLRRMEKDIVDR